MISLRETADGQATPCRISKQTLEVFRAGGWLESELRLEHRPQQESMAIRVAQALESDSPLLFEAGTGVGKSLSYLVPGIFFAADTGRPLVVSTHTISLQEQIQNQDLPLCRKLFSAVPALHRYRDFSTALLVGKNNYVCQTRLARALQASQQELFDDEEADELQRIAKWAETTRTGLRHELVPPPRHAVWDEVAADSSTCNRRNCGEDGCSYRRARNQVMAAQVRIVNHSLLFALLNAGARPPYDQRGVLFPDDGLILDEAHTIPSIATEHFGLSVSSYGIDFALKRLFNPRTQRGIFPRFRAGQNDCLLVANAIEASEAFFSGIRQTWLRSLETTRLREANWQEPLLQMPLKRIIDRIGSLEAMQENESRMEELRDHRRRLTTYYEAIAEGLALADPEQVYWLETTGRRRSIVHLRSAPLDVAPLLRETLFQRRTGVVMTSATLGIHGSLDIFRGKCGAGGVDGEVEHSPFDFLRNMRILVASDQELLKSESGLGTRNPSPPRERVQLNTSFLADYLLECIRCEPGGTMALFTSYGDLTAVARVLREPLDRLGRRLYVQGEELSRSELTRLFRRDANAVLFGTDSFWTGVDIPGPALSQVIVTRLPFDNPSHPVMEAKSEWIRSRGGSPFLEISLPDALIKFRQGIGRLIRTKADRGTVVILDPRILHKEYGKAFLAMLPHRHYHRVTRTTVHQAYSTENPQ